MNNFSNFEFLQNLKSMILLEFDSKIQIYL